MKKIIKITILALVLIIICPQSKLEAQESSYKLLAPLPCLSGNCNVLAKETKFTDYIPGVFKLAIGLSVAFVLLNLVFGGFTYMSADAFAKKSEGLTRINNSIKGLFLVVGAWLILNTIDPKFTDTNFNIRSANTVGESLVGGGSFSGGVGIGASTVINRATASCPESQCSYRGNLNYNLTPSNLNRLNCPTCEPAIGISFTSNTNINVTPETNVALSALRTAQPTGWQVSEAWPPIVNHSDPCHYVGTCVDVSIGQIQANPDNATRVNTLLNNALDSGFNPRSRFEVSPGQRQAWINAGVRPENIIEVQGVSPHFSLYRNGPGN